MQLHVTAISSLNDSMVYVGNFSRMETLPQIEVCKYRKNIANSSIGAYLFREESQRLPSYEVKDSNFNTALDKISCFNLERKPLISSGATDILIQKYDSTRELVWALRGGGNGHDEATCLTGDSLGNAFVSNHIYGNVSFDSRYPSGSEFKRDVVKKVRQSLFTDTDLLLGCCITGITLTHPHDTRSDECFPITLTVIGQKPNLLAR